MSMPFTIREATTHDGDAMLALMPRLADFEIPERRDPRHLWQDDQALLRRWLSGERDASLVQVAENDDDLLGFSLTSLRPEPLSHAPAAHLEAIAVAKNAEGLGVATALLAACEENARAHGAQFMTLHVFAGNTRARSLYERCGYEGELLRYIKSLD
ncbi:MAG: GNAT family N-acetyltransferase [Woeseia sp.]|nr:GNAT family N-acetyltransferase [Woeseia sp.]MBT8098051.1 GNAT family N-acetyltransferase [Woeseia sp.]NNE60080.1 GNAT family N-acetyltransferase [Woeseia sp.]NNL54767.1 GNAT family N-acetyltransferase [Woeseia sp.]